MTKEIILSRLSIIKRLYNIGVSQSEKPEIASFIALLSFHDSIDMFMNLAAETRGITKGLYLMQHFDKIPELTLKASVNKINDRRNNLKHNGQIPAKIEIDESKAIATLFFQENTPLIFSVDFDAVSLAQLIKSQTIKNHVLEAESYFEKKEFKECIIAVAKAYNEVENFQREKLFKEPSHAHFEREFYYLLPEMTREGEIFVTNPLDDTQRVKIDEPLMILNHVYKLNFGFLFDAINNLSLGMNYRDLVRFKRIVPSVMGSYGEKILTTPITNEDLLTEEKTAFVLNFIIEFSLMVQSR